MKPSKRQVKTDRTATPVADPSPPLLSSGSKGSDVPPGTPAWITRDLVAQTLKVWQPYYKEPLSTQDAVTIVLNVGKLFGVLSRE